MMPNMIITLTVLILPFAFVIIIERMKSKDRHKRFDLQADLYAKALEQGQPVPTDLFLEPTKPQKKNNPLNSLYTGIICVSLGIGVALFALSIIFFLGLSEYRSEDAWVIFTLVASSGIIPFLIGIAFIIIHFIKKKNSGIENT